MILEQYYLECLSHASYLIGDEQSKRAIVVDPRRDVADYLEEAARRDLRIEGVINTHFHADFVSGHLEIVDATGAWVGFGEAAQTDYPIRKLRHGEHITLGEVDIEILSTPGHTWESISLLVRDHRDAEPMAVLTGDSLFIGDVGRPDLANLGGGTNTELARAMYKTIHQTLLKLPDAVKVLPAHGAGSSCGKNMSTDLVSTIGQQRLTNPSVQPITEDEFVDLVTSGQPPVPGYFATDADLNRRNRAVFAAGNLTHALSEEELRAQRAAGATIIDTRDPEEFADSHLKGAINVGLAGRFAETCGMIAHVDDPIVLVTAKGNESEAALRLARIGYDNVQGYFNTSAIGNETPFPSSMDDLIERTHRVGPAELVTEVTEGRVTLLDVRNKAERDDGHIVGSLHIPLPQLSDLHSTLPQHKPIVVHCRSGWRSSVAASLLRSKGHDAITDLVGGYVAWVDFAVSP
ncbi:MBL fold metallo-hydrolase [Rhodococcus opacus]|uniref:MBL fold metallo-hydrolase n=1 Tax=Rhodococcus opacus TaxID=37919 RepID=UPI002949E165|nr:MBL fold metallo-hydrolase [Rhodococcus opacus]MDV6244899.1 MBL fold metallo-hydrolase [Rhodococcus opacus]